LHFTLSDKVVKHERRNSNEALKDEKVQVETEIERIEHAFGCVEKEKSFRNIQEKKKEKKRKNRRGTSSRT